MKIRTKTFALVLLIILCSCCKEDVPVQNSIFGDWSIVQIDSVRVVTGLYFNANHLSTIPWKGQINFSRDSSGRFLPAIPFLTDTVAEFTWSHNKILNQIFFDSKIGKTYAIIKYQVADTLEFYLKSFKPGQGVGISWFCYLKLTKETI